MKRWFFMLAGLFAVLMVAAVALWFVARQMEPLESRLRRIEVGMSKDEARAIMGRQEDSFTPGGQYSWCDRTGVFYIQFDPEDHVKAKWAKPLSGSEP